MCGKGLAVDFTLKVYRRLLQALMGAGYVFQTFAEFADSPQSRAVVLRHDVDRLPEQSLVFARLQAEHQVRGSYYFRIVPASFDEGIIRAIADLGHEIGYHYEDLSLVNGNWSLAIRSFEKNIEKLRRIVPIETICMHGSPLSKFDNRLLWQKYDYRNFGIIGEPYLDIDFNDVFYLTDTGRRWDGDGVSLRDKASTSMEHGAWSMGQGAGSMGHGAWSMEQNRQSAPRAMRHALRFRKTFDIIHALEQGLLPDKIMLTIHPQRWHDRLIPWTKELVWQNGKNVVKALVVKRRKGRVGLKERGSNGVVE